MSLRQNSSAKSFENLNQSTGKRRKPSSRERGRKRDKYRELCDEPADGRQSRGSRRYRAWERDMSKDVPIQMSWTFKIFRMLNRPGPGISIFVPPSSPFRAKRAGRSPSVTRTKFRISSFFILPHCHPSAFRLLSFLKQLMAHYVPQFIFHCSHAEYFWAWLSPY